MPGGRCQIHFGLGQIKGDLVTAQQEAMDRIAQGQPRGLAIHLAAKSYGLTTKALAARLAARRRPPQQTTSETPQWWNN
jgi:hypothetical protein